ncbi:MAG: DUF1501 domain-containing protein [Gemmataceae bacterium]
MPHTARVADDLCFIKSMHTEAINHDPAITSSSQRLRPAGPAWAPGFAYGLGEREPRPARLHRPHLAGHRKLRPINCSTIAPGARSSPSRYQGVKFRLVGDPVLYLSNPDGMDTGTRRRILDDVGASTAPRGRDR